MIEHLTYRGLPMNRAVRPATVVAMGILLSLLTRSAVAATNEAVQALDPKAIALIEEWGAAHGALQQFKIEVRDTIDEVAESGRKLQYAHRLRAIVSRPDRLRIESEGDLRNRTIYKDGRSVTIVDRDEQVFVRVPDPGTIDEMLDLMNSRYGVTFPLADMVSAKASGSLLAGVRTAEYVGKHRVGSYSCHHLAFTQDTIDWQVWLDADEGLQLRKMVITYKLDDGAPQYTMWVTQFDVLDAAPDALFAFEPSPELKNITLRPLSEGPWDE